MIDLKIHCNPDRAFHKEITPQGRIKTVEFLQEEVGMDIVEAMLFINDLINNPLTKFDISLEDELNKFQRAYLRRMGFIVTKR